MALGFGFNKQKVMAAAEKFVQQGKLPNAITEYEKVAKEDPKDLTVLNTIGDLYTRVGKSDQAATYFKRVGDAYASEGFTVKAIAMYKKLAKLAPGTETVLKLAELYTQQGLYNDARQQYVVAADVHMKAGDLESACRVFQKMLELDPENTAMQAKLADLYIKLGKRDNARNIYFTAAQSLYLKGAMDAADEALGRVLSLDPGNSDALMMRGQIAVDSGDGAAAITCLEKIPDLDSRPDALRALLRAYLSAGRAPEAEPIAQKLVSVHNDLTGVQLFAEAELAAGHFEEALKVYDRYADQLLATSKDALLTSLNSSINRIKDSAPALELLQGLYRKAAETTHICEVNELLAHAYVQAGELQKAKGLYKELAELEPENPLHEQSYKQIVARLGEDSAARPLTAEESSQAFMVEELEQGAPPVEQHYTKELEEAIKLALTDSELYDSYNLPAKALAPLEGVIGKAPRDVRLNQRLAALYARAEDWARGAQCCDVLQTVYTEAGHDGAAGQYADMAAKYREKAKAIGMEAPPAEVPAMEMEEAAAEAPEAVAEMSVEAAPAEEAAAEAPAVAEFDMAAAETAPPPPEAAHEVDLSTEWESMMTVEAPAPAEAAAPPAEMPAEAPPVEAPPAEAPPPEIPEMVVEAVPTAQFVGQEAAAAGAAAGELIEEIRFCLANSMWDEARASIERCAALAPDLPELAELRQQVEAAATAAPAAPVAEEEPAASVAEFIFEKTPEPPVEEAPPPPPPPPPPAPKPAAKVKKAAPPPPPPPPPKPAAKAAPKVAPPPPPPPPAASGDVLGGLVSDLEQSLGEDFAFGGPAAPAAQAPPPPAAAPPVSAAPEAVTAMPQEAASVLTDMFAEFKEDVEESAGEAEDPDTHYNLGVAFKEMGLLDEAIGELQKVCHAIEKGYPFTQVMQAYTWLANCFLEKGVPQAAIKWYEKALKLPGLEEDSRLAVYYELASAYEAAGNKKAALDNFLEVYGSNIDYRDVAERIKALKP